MAVLHIGRLFSGLSAGCCPAQVAGVIFDTSLNALKKIQTSPDVWTMNSYVAASHDSYCIPLSEHAERSQYYYINFDTAQFTLPTSVSTPYTIEFWQRSDSANPYSRSSDTYLGASIFYWNGDSEKEVASPIDQDALTKLVVQHKAVASVAYNHTTKNATIHAWLEVGGVLSSDSTQADIEWKDSDGTSIASVSVTVKHSVIADVFAVDIPLVNLTADTVTGLAVTITDSSGAKYTTHRSVVIYD